MKREPRGRPLEILLVEDSPTFARITIGALRCGRIDHHLTWLADGAEASQFLHRAGRHAEAPRPDLILLDLGLPGKDGREILAEIRADNRLAGIPVVVMTSSTSDEDQQECERLEVASYLTKPVDLSKFLAAVRELRCHGHGEFALPAEP